MAPSLSVIFAILFAALIAGGAHGQNTCSADVAVWGNLCVFPASFDIEGQNICSPGVQSGCYVLVNCLYEAGSPTSLTMSIYDNENCDGDPIYEPDTISPGSCQSFSTCALGQSYASMSIEQMAGCCGGATSEQYVATREELFITSEDADHMAGSSDSSNTTDKPSYTLYLIIGCSVLGCLLVSAISCMLYRRRHKRKATEIEVPDEEAEMEVPAKAIPEGAETMKDDEEEEVMVGVRISQTEQ